MDQQVFNAQHIVRTIVTTNSTRNRLTEMSKALKNVNPYTLNLDEWKEPLSNLISKLIQEWRNLLKSKKHDVIQQYLDLEYLPEEWQLIDV